VLQDVQPHLVNLLGVHGCFRGRSVLRKEAIIVKRFGALVDCTC
jgi:hypothetical protein